jgi:oligopeptide/dipeptide ABC transporter ATP-binding protein
VSLTINVGETLALVGESGSGKTLTALSLARLVPSPPAQYPGGQVCLEGRDVMRLSEPQLRKVRGRVISYVFQEPAVALNPVLRIGAQIREALRLHRPEMDTRAEVVGLLRLVGIPDPEARCRAYPHQLSGGMQQRVLIAMAIAPHPKLLVADEPTTALDATIQSQIVELLRQLRRELGMAMLIITHNLALVADLADRVAVMYAGEIVETGATHEVLMKPFHPYTRALRGAMPDLGVQWARLPTIPGAMPLPVALPPGCRFHPRCPQAQPDCRVSRPVLTQITPGRVVRCPHWDVPGPSDG